MRQIVKRSLLIQEPILHLLRQLIINFELLIPNLKTNTLRELVKQSELIPLTVVGALLRHFRAATPELLRGLLQVSKPMMHRYLDLLVDLGLAVRVGKAAKARGRPGPKSLIYAVPGFTEQDIRRAHEMEIRRTTKFLYPVLKARDLAISLMEMRGVREISLERDLIPIIRESGLASRFDVRDIATETARLLELDGVKVWRG